MIRALLILFLSIIYLDGFSQKIGDDANSIKLLVENEVRSYYNAQGYHQVRQDYKVLWNDGKIAEVILEKENVPDPFFQRPISFRVRYVMKGGKLDRMYSEYFDVETEELKKSARYRHQGNIIDEYLFSSDYTTYSRIYTGKNGLATWETKQTVIGDFPAYLQSTVKKDLADSKVRVQKETARAVMQKRNEQREEYDYKNTWYDLAEHNPDYYNELKESLKKKILQYLSKSFEPSFEDLLRDSWREGSTEIKNVYKIRYKKVDKSRKAVISGGVIIAGSDDIHTENECTLISGADKDCRFIRQFAISLPFIDIDGKKRLTEATYDSLSVQFLRGVALIRVSKKGIVYKQYEPKDDVLKAKIEQAAKDKAGNFIVRYELGNILGEPIEKIEFDVPNSSYRYKLF